EDITKLQDRLLQNPKDVRSRVKLAAILDNRGSSSEAEDLLSSALQMGQRSFEIYYALGTLYQNHSQIKAAREEFKIVTELAPKRFEGHLRLAQCDALTGRSKEATEEFEKAKKIDSSVAETYLGLAFMFDAPARYPEALRYLDQYFARSKQTGPGYG